MYYCRLVEVTCNRVQVGPKEDTPLESLTVNSTKIYRIEEVPLDEVRLLDDEMLISCAHFHKEVFSTFGVPFLVKVKNGEPFSRVKGTFQLLQTVRCVCNVFLRSNTEKARRT